MANRFESRGMSRSDAEMVVNTMAKYENFFVGLMVAEELGLQLPEDDDAILITDAIVMFISFAVFGSIPILIHCLGSLNILTDETLFVISMSLSMSIMFILGSVKSSFSSANWIYSGFESLIIGILCAVVSYLIGATLVNMIY